MLCILNCSSNDELRTLRHQILAQVSSQVVSPKPEEALAQVKSKKYDVLVICDPAVDRFFDTLCMEFRHANPSGRVVAIQGAARTIALCEADITVDAYDPKALVEAITSYPEVRSKFKHERRLTHSEKGTFLGWYCDRCCWNRPEASVSEDAEVYARGVQADFETHSCEAYAREEWQSSAAVS